MFNLYRIAAVCRSPTSLSLKRPLAKCALININHPTLHHTSHRFRMSSSTQKKEILDSTDASSKTSQEIKVDDISSFREALRSQHVSMTDFANHPVEQFLRWFKDACDAKVIMPNAMVLSTAQISNGIAKPSSRAVLLKDVLHKTKAIPAELYMSGEGNLGDAGVDLTKYFGESASTLSSQGAFTFCTNYESRKGQEIDSNPYASLYFIWHELERAVRIEGTITRTPESLSDHYHHSRPRSSRISACISQQSRPIDSYDTFAQRYEETTREFDSKRATSDDPQQDLDIPRPVNWGGLVIKPERVEFWQGRRSRAHERLEYNFNEQGQWVKQFLQP